MLLPHNSPWIVMVSVDQVIKTSTAHSPQSADITIPECRFGQGTSKQSNDRPPNETTRALCQPCCEPANACCAALDDLQLLSPPGLADGHRPQSIPSTARWCAATGTRCLPNPRSVFVHRRVWHHVCHVTADQHGRSRLTRC
jgi:hypothetical protein